MIHEKRNLRTVVLEVVFLLASAAMLSLAFPSFCSRDGWPVFALFSLIPLFMVIRSASWKVVWFYGFIYGFVFYWIFNYWLSAFHPLANLLVQIIKGGEMVMLFLALKAAVSWFPSRFTALLQALFWMVYAYLAQTWFAGYPYGTIAYAIFRWTVLIQIADFSGIWLLTFLLVLPQAFLGNWLSMPGQSSGLSGGNVSLPSFKSYIKTNIVAVCLFCAVVLFQLVYGIANLSYWRKAPADKSFNVATVQHNADSWAGGFATYNTNFINLRRMSLEAATQNPDMIIWSETAFVPSVRWYTEHPYHGDGKGASFDYLRNIQVLVDEFVSFGNTLGIPLLTGNPSSVLAEGETEPYTEDGDWNNKLDYNSVILFDEGTIKQTYLKQHLVPFTEHFPYEKTMPWLYNLLKANDYHWWEKGEESFVFETSNGIRFSTPICFEDVFGDLCADFADNGADLFVNMTNDSWSGSVAAERQHMAMAVFRSVENRRTMLRGTNSGITCLITPDGTVQGEMEPFKMGWKIWQVPVWEQETYGKTFYCRTADTPVRIISYISYLILAIGAVGKVLSVRRKKS